MKYYKSGEFAKMANVSLRTIRYYDQQGLLKPSMVTDSRYRLYTDDDLIKLQRIIALKSFGFSLDEIFAITVNDDRRNFKDNLRLQAKLVHQKIENLQAIEQALIETEKHIDEHSEIDWNMILHILHLSNMERDIVDQYKNSKNLSVRINLHEKYSTNQVSWFDWLIQQYSLSNQDRVLEIGCGKGDLWKRDHPDVNYPIVLSDISEGMLSDAKENLDSDLFKFEQFDMISIPHQDASFDKVIANHCLFYSKDMDVTLQEVARVLKDGGIFYTSSYGRNHMKEITELVKEFDPRISLSSTNLYEIFGLDNGKELLEKYFSKVELINYEDALIVDDYQAIIDYILSCHGNQNDYISNKYDLFKQFVKSKMKNGSFKITKNAGIFKCIK